MKRTWQSVVLLAMFLSIVGLGPCQDNPNVEVGLKPFGSFHGGDLDSVSMTNGNLTLHIPLWSFPQRGAVRLNYSILYNDKQWRINIRCTQLNGCTDIWRLDGPGITVVPDQGISLSSRIVQLTPTDSITILTAKTPDGASHQLAPVGGSTTVYESIDASGIRDGSTGMTDRSGVSGGMIPLPLKDLNGNEILTTGTSYTDTVGRSVPTPPTFAAGGDTSKCQNLPLATTGAKPWTIPAYGGTVTLTFCWAKVHFYHDNNDGPIFDKNLDLIQAIVLPNGTSWVFQYQPEEGNLTKVTFPTGGSVSYTWLTGQSACLSGADTVFSDFVKSRTVDANDGNGGKTWNYTWGTESYVPGVSRTRKNIVKDPLANETVYTISGIGQSCSFYESQRDHYEGNSLTGTLLKTVKTDYSYTSNPFDTYNSNIPTAANVVPIRVTTVWPGGKQSKVETDYDSGFTFSTRGPATLTGTYGSVIAKREYDYGQGTSGTLLRQTLTTYAWQSGSPNYQNYLAANLLDLPVSRIINNASYKCAETTYGYDDGARLFTPSPPVTIQHVSAPLAVRGNLSFITKKLSNTPCQANATWSSVTSYVNSYDTGMVYQALDPLSHTTTYAYDSTGTYRIQTNLPDTNSPNLAHHITTASYDANSGLLTSTHDENNQPTTYTYDSVQRTKLITYPSDGGQISFDYIDTLPSPSVTIKQRITSTPLLESSVVASVDGLGRLRRTQQSDQELNNPFIYVDTTYDAIGRKSTISNSYHSTGDSTYGVTTYQYDALSRNTKLIPADGTSSSNYVGTAYSGNQVTVTDEAGKQKKTQSDGLNRLTVVWEDPAVSNYETDYTYDALDNLLSVSQKGSSPTDSSKWRTRTFGYDSISRLISATNPESGTITYSYNSDDTLATRTAPQANVTSGSSTTTTTYCYDEVHRVRSKTYSLQSCPVASPAASFMYDQTSYNGLTISYPIGRRTGMSDGSGAAAWSYDTMGRPRVEQRTITGTSAVTKSIGYTYNLDGTLAALSYPSGRSVTYGTGIAGRTVSAVDQNGTPTVTTDDINYVTSGSYEPYGGLLSMKNGVTASFAGITTSYSHNKRLEPVVISAATSSANDFEPQL